MSVLYNVKISKDGEQESYTLVSQEGFWGPGEFFFDDNTQLTQKNVGQDDSKVVIEYEGTSVNGYNYVKVTQRKTPDQAGFYRVKVERLTGADDITHRVAAE